MEGALIAWAVAGIVAVLCLAGSLRYRKRHRLLHDLPTSKVRGVFIGLVELSGTAESETPLTSYLTSQRCVLFEWSVEEHWSRLVTTTDAKGNRRTRRESGWKTVADGGQLAPFFLHDDTGAILVDPEGATRDPITWFSQEATPADALYYDKGPREAVAHSSRRRRFVEHGFPLHAQLYLLGPASERDDVVAPRITAGTGQQPYILSTHKEERVKARLALTSWLTWSVGVVLCALPIALAARDARLAEVPVESASTTYPDWVVIVPMAAYLAFWSVGWIWMVFNSLVALRNRVLQGGSLIEVQLKRRHDLVPSLSAIVAGLQSHEAEVQTALAALRAQLAATPPGRPGPDHEGLTGVLRAVVERYPALTAQTQFARLHRELVQTEQRIALARAYYNDIATQFATRLDRIPDRWVARLGAMHPEPLLTAASFERATVEVKLAS